MENDCDMTLPYLDILAQPQLEQATMLLALTGWMDGGLVSTGTVERMMENRDLIEIARIDPDPFYIFNFPGSMEIAALFRPQVSVQAGLIEEFDWPTNTFHADTKANLVFFLGREPNLRWQEFADCIFEVAKGVGVSRIVFMGSFGGTVPHTREPRMYASASHPHLAPLLQSYGMQLSDYEGPASFATLLLDQAATHDIEMLSLVAEIPGYLQGINPLSIEAVSRRLSKILNQPVDLTSLRSASNEWETKVTEVVEKDPKLAARVRKFEQQYDNQLINPDAEQPGESAEEQEEEEDDLIDEDTLEEEEDEEDEDEQR
jgi:proteasome assembly chaperone (PAC2) family protein